MKQFKQEEQMKEAKDRGLTAEGRYVITGVLRAERAVRQVSRSCP